MAVEGYEGVGICEQHRQRSDNDPEYRQEAYRAPGQYREQANDPGPSEAAESSSKKKK